MGKLATQAMMWPVKLRGEDGSGDRGRQLTNFGRAHRTSEESLKVLAKVDLGSVHPGV